MRRIAALVVLLPTLGCQAQHEPAGSDPTSTIAESLSLPPARVWTILDDLVLAPIWVGNNDHGTLFGPLWRSALPGIEDFVYAPPDGDCRALKGTIRVDWDKASNTVHFLSKWRGLPLHPSVHRTSGVDFFPNAFHGAPKDFDDGSYRLWVILSSPTNKANFWYDGRTLQLQGSDFNFPSGPPAGTFPVPLPIFAITGSQAFKPQQDGSAIHEWMITYDHLQAEGGFFSFAYTSYTPQDLCESRAAQPSTGQLRPYVTSWFPPGQGPSWDTVLRSGLAFDLNAEETNAFPQTGGNLPYVFSGVAFIGNLMAMQGGVPRGSKISIPSSIQNVVPAFFPVPGGVDLGCHTFVNDPHVTAPRFCEGAH
jgi:hypothetical protein